MFGKARSRLRRGLQRFAAYEQRLSSVHSLPEGMVRLLTAHQALRWRTKRVAVVQGAPSVLCAQSQSMNTTMCKGTRAQC
jgi:hypothetical protein